MRSDSHRLDDTRERLALADCAAEELARGVRSVRPAGEHRTQGFEIEQNPVQRIADIVRDLVVGGRSPVAARPGSLGRGRLPGRLDTVSH